jgi:hypothetical protein
MPNANEPPQDIRVRAKSGDVSVQTEIKVAESWSINQLESALRNQLCRQYLRAKDTRHGILLLVHQSPRHQGGRDPKTRKYAGL